MLQIYNTLSKKKEIFKPLIPGKVSLYVCGITVYDYCHIGHARGVFLTFDTIVRYLKYRGYEVKYVCNITDIDDKIIKRAEEQGVSVQVITDQFIQAMDEDRLALNVLKPTVEPRATLYVEDMIHMIEKLVDKDYAYVAGNGDVYYHVEKFSSYGCLAHRNLEELQVGARVEANEAKKSPLDFVLWKAAKPGEPKWSSPWGEGRPSWHIECSVMSIDNLGETFDLHGGGADLKFPHHENERAQSEAVTGKKFVNTWMHVGFVQVDEQKMSKSLGNFLTIRDCLSDYNPEVLRYFTLASHYRSPVDWADEQINSAIQGLERLYTTFRGLQLEGVNVPVDSDYETRFQAAMDDDFNTPVALSVLFEMVREINRDRETRPEQSLQLAALLHKLGNILGLLYQSPETALQDLRRTQKNISTEEIEAFIEQRNEARKTKNWQESDRIRQVLLEKGIVLEDTSTGTLWRQSTDHLVQ